MEPSTLLIFVYVLMIGAAVLFVGGAVARFVRHHEATVWWRGAMGLLWFAIALLLLLIYFSLSGQR